MKKVTVLLFAMVMSVLVQAQTIHWLTFIDTTDDKVGRIDILGRQVLYNRFVNVINAALAPAGYSSDIQDYYGSRTTPENCKDAIQNLKCDKNDIVVFYYIGHGTRSKDDPTPYPQMLLTSTNIDKFIPLSWVNEQLKTKEARLTITIGMCCNAVQDVTPKMAPTFGVNYGNTYLQENELQNIQKLFLENRGNIIVTSASPGQSSYCVESNSDDNIIPKGAKIDTYTYMLVHNFDHHVKSKASASWQRIFDDTKEFVNKFSEGEQTPIHDIKINSAQKADEKKQANIDEKPINQNENNDERLNRVVKMLDLIIDVTYLEEKRIIAGNLFKLAFLAPDAEVKILSQDGEMVVDKETGAAFIDRLSTSRLLLKVAVESCKYVEESGNIKIKELRVREIYKKKDNK